MKVIIYSTPICPYCHLAKKYLQEKNIDFEEIDVSSDPNAQEMILEKTGELAVPVIEIDGKFIKGFDKLQIDEILGLN
ncbi:MAG: Glutaredoxin-3 [Parcubacteria group bacterium ADurb.Bin159]|jgi:glutaredoxin-like YruB-family protein|nr:MAG: Glutaredoxin-3 [Parcubacteria group bacterium ADurb.Bin159]